MEYTVPVLDSPDFSKCEKAMICCYKWTAGYAPKAFAQLLLVRDKGFYLRMTACESAPKAIYRAYDDPVYKDSCLEFFVSFNIARPEYMNFEMNSNGAFLAARRKSRHDKAPIDTLYSLPAVTAFSGDGYWGTEVFFPLDFVEALFGKRDFAPGDCFKGNFYKCGDETEIPHFGMWSPVENDTPDFHRPEFFGTFVIGG